MSPKIRHQNDVTKIFILKPPLSKILVVPLGVHILIFYTPSPIPLVFFKLTPSPAFTLYSTKN